MYAYKLKVINVCILHDGYIYIGLPYNLKVLRTKRWLTILYSWFCSIHDIKNFLYDISMLIHAGLGMVGIPWIKPNIMYHIRSYIPVN